MRCVAWLARQADLGMHRVLALPPHVRHMVHDRCRAGAFALAAHGKPTIPNLHDLSAPASSKLPCTELSSFLIVARIDPAEHSNRDAWYCKYNGSFDGLF